MKPFFERLLMVVTRRAGVRFIPVLLMVAAGLGTLRAAGDVSLGQAAGFAVLGGSAVTNTGSTQLFGDLGVSPGSAISGFPPGTFSGTLHNSDGVALQAQADALTAYNTLAGLAPTLSLTGQDLGGMTLTPGVYFFASSAQLTGNLTLDGQGLLNPLFVFQIGSTLTTASSSSIFTIDGADASNVYFQVGSSATLGTSTAFQGILIASDSDTLTTGATVNGQVIALNGAVTLDTNVIAVPEPGSMMLLGLGMVVIFVRGRRRGWCAVRTN